MESQASKKDGNAHRVSGGAEKGGDMIPAVSISVLQESDRRISGCSSDDQSPQVSMPVKIHSMPEQ